MPGMRLQRRHHRHRTGRVRYRLCVRSTTMRDAEQRTSTAIPLHAHLTWMDAPAAPPPPLPRFPRPRYLPNAMRTQRRNA
jgi:hypothetical protein